MRLNHKKSSVCYANPTLLLRRPISELLALQEGGRKLGLLTPSRAAKHEQQLHHTTLFKEAEVLAYKAWRLPGPFEWPIPRFSFFKQAWKALGEYDVIHAWAHFYLSTMLLLLMSRLKKRRRRPKIILTMDTLPGYSFSGGAMLDLAFKLWTWTFGRIVYTLPDVITLYGASLLTHAKQSLIKLKKVKVIPTGILQHQLPSRKGARQRVAKELRISKEKSIVLYAGLLNPRKHVQDFLRVASQVPDALFLIAGDGPSRKKLERQKKKLKLKNVRFLGWRRDLLTLMRAADLFLFPSGAEGLPGVVMEAMYCGTPVVTTKIPCTTDLISDGKEGLLCNVGDVACLTEKSRELLKEPKRARRLATNGKEKIKNYSWKEIIKDYEQLYDS